MTIRYADGQSLEAVLLSRTETTLRVAIEGGEDSLEFNFISGVWVSEDCEPVQIEFSWSRHRTPPQLAEADFICSHELAARLIHLLYAGEEETVPSHPPLAARVAVAALQQVV